MIWKNERKKIIFLAYFGNFIFPALLVLASLLSKVISKNDETILLCLSISLLLMAAYNMIGYWFRWKHIYCIYQLSKRQKLTPENIQWDEMSFGDIYGIPIVFSVVGLIGIFCYFIV